MSEFFPKSRSEALTMLYLQNQDLSDKSPEELVKLYQETYKRIYDEFAKSNKAKARFF